MIGDGVLRRRRAPRIVVSGAQHLRAVIRADARRLPGVVRIRAFPLRAVILGAQDSRRSAILRKARALRQTLGARGRRAQQPASIDTVYVHGSAEHPPAPTPDLPVPGHAYDLALVLSGGGARGFSHIGVLEVVQELQLPVDLVVGVSMGSVVGAAYAAGLSPAEMADLARAMRLTSIFRPRPGWLNLIDPTGIRATMSRIFGDRRFADLERELVIVSSSMTTGEHVVIRDGSIVDAIVSSCSIPLVFPPVSLGGHELLDGGLIDGFPVTVARELGARRIVAVDASTHARHVLRLPVFRHATRGVVHILNRRRARADLDAVRIFSRVLHYATLSPPRPPVEVLIRPAFGRRSTLHYHRWSDMVACGRAAGEAARPLLAALLTPRP